MIRRIDKPFLRIDDTFLSNRYEKPEKYILSHVWIIDVQK